MESHSPPPPTLMCVCGLVGFGSQWHSNDYAFSSSRKYQWAKRTPPTRAFGKTANKNNTESGRMNTSRGPYAVRFADFRAAAFQSESLMPRIFSIHGASCYRRGLFSCDPAMAETIRANKWKKKKTRPGLAVRGVLTMHREQLSRWYSKVG